MADVKQKNDIHSIFKFDEKTKSNKFYKIVDDKIYYNDINVFITKVSDSNYENISITKSCWVKSNYKIHGDLIIKETERNENSDNRVMSVSLWSPSKDLHSSPEFGFTVTWGWLKDCPAIVAVNNYGDYGFDQSTILFGRNHDYEIDSLTIKPSTTKEEIAKFKSAVMEFYTRKYHLSK